MLLEETPTCSNPPVPYNQPSKKFKRKLLPFKESGPELLSEFFPSQITLKEFKTHQDDYWQILAEESLKHNLANCLQTHSITSLDRAASVNWLLDTVAKLKCSANVFFKSVAILDLFHARSAM